MNIDKIKAQIERAFLKVRGIPMTQNQYDDLCSFFQQLVEPWKNCILEKCPMKPDSRQKTFQSVIESIAPEFDEVKATSMDCYPAAYVNIGWLRDTTKELIEKDEIQSIEDLVCFITKAVQRVKEVSVEPECQQNTLIANSLYYHVDFTTKDDCGRYHYGYHIVTEKELSEDRKSMDL